MRRLMMLVLLNVAPLLGVPDVPSVSVVAQTETEIKLEWKNSNSSYWYVLIYDAVENNISSSDSDLRDFTASSLTPGTNYSFTLHTVFDGVRSSGFNFSNVTVPSNVETVSVVHHNDSDIVLEWQEVANVDNNSYTYTLQWSGQSDGGSTLMELTESHYSLSGLIPATNYSFTLFTKFCNVNSSGYNFTQTTTLSDVTDVSINRSQDTLTITWEKLHHNDIYNYSLTLNDTSEVLFDGWENVSGFAHTYRPLTSGTQYSFTLHTVVNGVTSPGQTFPSVTTIDCSSFQWNVTNSSVSAAVEGCTHLSVSEDSWSPVEEGVARVLALVAGRRYSVSLWYQLSDEMLLQCSHHLTLVPNNVIDLACKSLPYGLTVQWTTQSGDFDSVSVKVNGEERALSSANTALVKGLQAARWYRVDATTCSGAQNCQSASVNCQTDTTGVIAGVLVFLLLSVVCAALFLWFRRSRRKRRPRSPLSQPELHLSDVFRKIPCEEFAEHFQRLSRDQNRGFSEEYESLSCLGTEQSSAAARLPENKEKNRFLNVLAYDCSRVHLSSRGDGDSGYINASFMPGFGGSSCQYIAAQGPLPNTLEDFWRMVWEKRSTAVVMLTNCVENGRVKCEQYWPADHTPLLFSNLLVSVEREEKTVSWTLRDFAVENRESGEVRRVRHFHFTAWPDHGVPGGTEELMRFRQLLRQHASPGPPVVHCSAGVGRTGTLIALDVLLKQLEKDRAVGVAGVVRQMRMSRPLMVQTESQYVFLHRCIMDALQSSVLLTSESLYENTDLIYANAAAVTAFQSGSQI